MKARTKAQKRPGFLRERVSRIARLPVAGPLAETRLAYVFNAFTSGLIPLDHYSLRETDLLRAFMTSLGADAQAPWPSRLDLPGMLQKLLDSAGDDLCVPPAPRDPLRTNLAVVSDFFGLNDTERQLL